MEQDQNLVGRLMDAGKQLLQKIGMYEPPPAQEPSPKPSAQAPSNNTDTPRLPWNVYDLREFYRKQNTSANQDEQSQAR